MAKTKAGERKKMDQRRKAAALGRIAGKRKRLPAAADHRARAELGIDRLGWPYSSEDEQVEPVWASGAPESGAPESGGESPARLGDSFLNPIVIEDDDEPQPPAKRPCSPSEDGIIKGAFDSEIRDAHVDDDRAIADGAAALAAFATGGLLAASGELPVLTEAEVARELGN